MSTRIEMPSFKEAVGLLLQEEQRRKKDEEDGCDIAVTGRHSSCGRGSHNDWD